MAIQKGYTMQVTKEKIEFAYLEDCISFLREKGCNEEEIPMKAKEIEQEGGTEYEKYIILFSPLDEKYDADVQAIQDDYEYYGY